MSRARSKQRRWTRARKPSCIRLWARRAKPSSPSSRRSRYVDILRHLAALREPVYRFFDGVTAMPDDAAKRTTASCC